MKAVLQGKYNTYNIKCLHQKIQVLHLFKINPLSDILLSDYSKFFSTF